MYLVLLDVSIAVVLVAATFMLTLGQQTSYIAVFAELLGKCVQEAYSKVSVRLIARTLAFFLLLSSASVSHGQLATSSTAVKYLGATSSSLVTGTSDSLLLSMDGDGNLLLGDSVKGQVSRVAMTGGIPVVVLSNVPGITAITGDATGRVLVATKSLDHIVEVRAGSATKTMLGSGLNDVQSMVLDSQGNLIIADTGNNRVVRVTPSGSQSMFVNSITTPTAVFLDSTNDLFVGSAGALTAYRTNGTITPVGQGWSQPIAISQSGNEDLYVLDSGLRQLVVVNANTSAQSVLLGTDDRIKPTSVISDAGGNLYVFDKNAHQVVKLDPSIQLGSVKAGVPSDLTTLSFEFLAPTTLSKIFTFTQGDVDGQLQANGGSCITSHTYESGDQCTVILQATLLKAGRWNGDLTLLDTNGKNLLDTQVFATGVAPLQGLLPGLAQTYYRNPYSYTGELIPSSLAVDVAGNLYIGDDANARVLRVAASGNVDVVLSNANIFPSGGVGDPLALAVDGKGDLLVADDSLAWGITPDLSLPGTFEDSVFMSIAYGQWGPSETFVSFMTGLAVQPGGGFFFSDSGNNRVISVDNTGFGIEILNASTVVGDNGQGLNYPMTLAIDNDGTLLIADFGNQRIVQRFADGTARELVSPGTLLAGQALQQPMGLAVDPAGNVYISDASTNRVIGLTPQGQSWVIMDATAPVDGNLLTPLNNPQALALDSNGNLFIADVGNERVIKLNRSALDLQFNQTRPAATSNTLSFKVQNLGNASLALKSVNTSSMAPNFSVSSATTCSSTSVLVSDASCSFAAVFSPTEEGTFTSRLAWTSNTQDVAATPAYVSLSGSTSLAVDHFRVIAAPSDVVAGAPFSYTLRAEDPQDNPVTGYRGSVNLAWSEASNQAASYTFTGSDGGSHTFAGVLLDKAGVENLAIADSSNPALSAGATVIVYSGVPTSLTVISGSGQSAMVGKSFAAPLVVEAQDSFGNITPGVPVIFIAPGNGASAFNANNQTAERIYTDSTGLAYDYLSAGEQAGTYKVQASLNASVVDSFTLINQTSGFTLSAGPAPVVLGTSNTASADVLIAPLPGFSGVVKMACSRVGGYTCTLSETSVSIGEGADPKSSAEVHVTITRQPTQSSGGSSSSTGKSAKLSAVALIVGLGALRRRVNASLFRSMSACIVLCCVGWAIVGCSGVPTSKTSDVQSTTVISLSATSTYPASGQSFSKTIQVVVHGLGTVSPVVPQS